MSISARLFKPTRWPIHRHWCQLNPKQKHRYVHFGLICTKRVVGCGPHMLWFKSRWDPKVRAKEDQAKQEEQDRSASVPRGAHTDASAANASKAIKKPVAAGKGDPDTEAVLHVLELLEPGIVARVGAEEADAETPPEAEPQAEPETPETTYIGNAASSGTISNRW